MTENNYIRFNPEGRNTTTNVPVENYTPLDWQVILIDYGIKFGLLPEYIDNVNAFHASGLEKTLIQLVRNTNQCTQRIFADNRITQEEETEYSDIVYESQIELSAQAARVALDLFSGNLGLLFSLEGKEEDLSKDLSNILPHEKQLREELKLKGSQNETQVVQAYRTIYSMSQLMYLMFMGEVDTVKRAIEITPDIYLSCLTYLTTMARTRLSNEMDKSKDISLLPADNLAAFLLEDNSKALRDIFFTVDLAESAPDTEDIAAITHFLTIHSRLIGILGDTLFLTKLFRGSHLPEEQIPAALSSHHKDKMLLNLIYGENNPGWFNLIEPPDNMPLLILLGLKVSQNFADKLEALIKNNKTAIHAAWKNALRIFADPLHDGINFIPYSEKLDSLLRKHNLIPGEGLLISPNRILEMIANISMSDPEGLTKALDYQTYRVPDLYKFRFFIEDVEFYNLIKLLIPDLEEKNIPQENQPYFLFVDPKDNSIVQKIYLSELDSPRQKIEEQFAKGGRAMLFIHLSLPAFSKQESEDLSHSIELQFTLMSKTKEFYEQRFNYGIARLIGH